ncbi:hypothetical protein PCANC_11676 [Puccinia coronata f. sp. avenae]|uniref:Uncharacterized protein n=1 Tax=Puccinia coronata f. sp. avenae TaxID=200324 RepID=A0A2N5VXJ4_9BASI|nr:hypothetical protein PCANC_11676 [Puccinia coronata f. sp. avenae]
MPCHLLARHPGWLTTPATKNPALGPIWFAMIDPLNRTGIGVAAINTQPVSTQPTLSSFFLFVPSGMSTGRIVGSPFAPPQQSTAYCMTVIRTAKATHRSTPYPYQSPISRAYHHQNLISLIMHPSSDAYPSAVRAPTAVPPPFEDIYFDSNGVLFQNSIAIVDQHGSIICQSIVERFLPVFCPPLVEPETLALRSNRAIIGYAAHHITPQVFDPYPVFVESCSVPQSLVEHLYHNGQGANNASEDAQDIIANHFYNTAAPPAPRPASEPRAPTTYPINTDSDPADAQSEPLLTNDQGDPVSVTYPFTNFSCLKTPNPPGFFDPKDYHWLNDDQIHDLLCRDHEPARFDRFAFGPQHLTDLYQLAMSAMVSNYTQFPPCNGDECADCVQTFKTPTGLSTTSCELQG